MSERDAFERRLEEAVRAFVEAAPTEVDAARLTHSLVTNVPRVRRIVPVPVPVRVFPSPRFAWVLVAAALVTVLGIGVVATGGLRDVILPSVPPTPGPGLQTPPAVIVSPSAATPEPSASPSATPEPSAAPPSGTLPVGFVLSSAFVGESGRPLTGLEDALAAAGYSAQIRISSDSASEKAEVEALIGEGIKVLVFAPWDGTDGGAVADEARDAGVKVIAYDRQILGASVDYFVTFASTAVGAAQAQYLIERAGTTTGNSLYLYAGNAANNNTFVFFEGAWETLQPRIADGTFVIRNSSEAVALQDKATLTHDEQAAIIGQIDTEWNADVARSLASRDLAAAPPANGRAFILAPNDWTAGALADVFTDDPNVTAYYVTGQDADQAWVQRLIDGTPGMTVFKDPRTLAEDAIAGAVAFLTDRTPVATTTTNNGSIDVPTKGSAVVAVTIDNIQAALIDSGFYQASDFTGTWPGKPSTEPNQPQPASIVSHMTINLPAAPNAGTFAATGSSPICASGTVLDLDYVFAGFKDGRWSKILVQKEFTCNDGSGSFFVKLQVHPKADGTESFTWVVQGGTGDYENLRGCGDGTTAPDADGVINTYKEFVIG